MDVEHAPLPRPGKPHGDDGGGVAGASLEWRHAADAAAAADAVVTQMNDQRRRFLSDGTGGMRRGGRGSASGAAS
jgi:hypothetical protein